MFHFILFYILYERYANYNNFVVKSQAHMYNILVIISVCQGKNFIIVFTTIFSPNII